MELKTIQLPSVQGHTLSFASDCRVPALSIYRIPLRFTSRPQLFPIWTDPKPQSIQDGGIHGSPPTVSCVWLCKQLFCFSGGHGDEANGAVHSWPNLSDLCHTWPPAVHGASVLLVEEHRVGTCGIATGYLSVMMLLARSGGQTEGSQASIGIVAILRIDHGRVGHVLKLFFRFVIPALLLIVDSPYMTSAILSVLKHFRVSVLSHAGLVLLLWSAFGTRPAARGAQCDAEYLTVREL